MRPTETIIIDAVDQNLGDHDVECRLSRAGDPDAWFQREYLPRLKVE